MIGRIVRSGDFERVLRTPSRARSTHFAVHFLPATPALGMRRVSPSPAPQMPELSTGMTLPAAPAVDDLPDGRVWIGAVVPKRHARRAVTRSLLKRQIRGALTRQSASGLRSGLWVVRLRSPFDRTVFASAASGALATAAADELQAVLARAARQVDEPPGT